MLISLRRLWIHSFLLSLCLALVGCGNSSDAGGKSPDGGKSSQAGDKAPASTDPAGGSSDFESRMVAYIDELNKLTDLFKQVQDEASAKEMAPKIKAQITKLNSMGGTWGNEDAVTKANAMQKHMQQWGVAQQGMTQEMLRIMAKPALAKEMGDGMKIKPPK